MISKNFSAQTCRLSAIFIQPKFPSPKATKFVVSFQIVLRLSMCLYVMSLGPRLYEPLFSRYINWTTLAKQKIIVYVLNIDMTKEPLLWWTTDM